MLKHHFSVKQIVFDLYNTLIYIDTPEPYLKSFFHSFDHFHRKRIISNLLTSDFTSAISYIEIVALEKNIPFDINLFIEKIEREINSTKIFPDVIETLKVLKKEFPLFLISNLATPYKAPFFQLGLDQYFESPLFSCDIGKKKPDPDIFKMIPGTPNETLVIGDSVHSDYLGARKVDMHALVICRDKQILRSDNSIPHISSLTQLINFST